MSDYEGEFTINNYYTIQINILYNTKDKDTDDSNSDDLNNNYFIINNMQDILIEEFKNPKKYDYFKSNYVKEKKNTPLYIVNDSFYIDKSVIEAIRKVTIGSFPKYPSGASIASEKEKFKNYVTKFKSIANIRDYEEQLIDIFKKVYIKTMSNQARRDEQANVESLTTFDDLTNNDPFMERAGSKGFHSIIQQTYETTQNNTLKQALKLFYNIPSNKLSNKSKYEYFLNPNTVNTIFKLIDDNISSAGEDYMYGQRKPTLNDNRTKEEIYTKYYKYLFPNKKDISNLNDSDKDKILMFYNVYYIIKNIYLLDDTIINITKYRIKKPQGKKKYYIKQVGLLELNDNITHFQIKDNKVIIFIKATLEYIIENPIVQINYLIDDLENARQNYLPQSYILEPKDISNNYSNYKNIYIHDKIKYTNITYDIDYFANVLRKKNTIKNKEEFFFNTQALKLFNNYFKAKLESKKDEKVVQEIIESNIKFLLYTIFKFYNNKVLKKYYIADTYIQYFNVTSPTYYSISKKSIITEKSEKYNIISTLFTETSQQEESSQQELPIDENPESILAKPNITKRIYKTLKSPDARLEDSKIYKINVVFRCFLDKNGKKPTIIRKLVAESCLYKAQKLDEAFTNTLYKTFRLPENYLYNKLANITHKQKPNVALEKNVDNKRGGKNSTRKYKNISTIKFTNNNIT